MKKEHCDNCDVVITDRNTPVLLEGTLAVCDGNPRMLDFELSINVYDQKLRGSNPQPPMALCHKCFRKILEHRGIRLAASSVDQK